MWLKFVLVGRVGVVGGLFHVTSTVTSTVLCWESWMIAVKYSAILLYVNNLAEQVLNQSVACLLAVRILSWNSWSNASSICHDFISLLMLWSACRS